MLIINVERLNSKKSLVLLENGRRWPLYNTELSKYGLWADNGFDDELYKTIDNDVILRRAKIRALNLLKAQDRTVKQLTDKLTKDGYDESTIALVKEYLDRFGYLDDYRIADNYCRYHMNNMSSQELKRKLYTKGIPGEIISAVTDELGDSDELALQALIKKKNFAGKIIDAESYRKSVGFLIRRGFSYELIKKYLSYREFEE